MRFAVVSAIALVLSPIASGTLVQFRTPSGNIGCVYSSAEGRLGSSLRCDILSGLKPRPPRPPGCQLDWGSGYAMNAARRAHVVCAGDTAVDKRARVLRYGSKWSRGGFTCVSRRTGLRCRNRSGHGWLLSRRHSYLF